MISSTTLCLFWVYIDQLNDNSGPRLGNKVLINQEGRNNRSNVDQDNDANWAKTTQFGKKNKLAT